MIDLFTSQTSVKVAHDKFRGHGFFIFLRSSSSLKGLSVSFFFRSGLWMFSHLPRLSLLHPNCQLWAYSLCHKGSSDRLLRSRRAQYLYLLRIGKLKATSKLLLGSLVFCGRRDFHLENYFGGLGSTGSGAESRLGRGGFITMKAPD